MEPEGFEISKRTEESAMKVEVFCSCGGGIRGKVESSDEKAIQKIVKIFRSVHNMSGCSPSDAATAKKARQKK